MPFAPPRIGITCRFDQAKSSYWLDERYVAEVTAGGGVPVVLPFTSDPHYAHLLSGLDGLLFTGGEDIHPSVSGGGAVREDYTYYPRRDTFEIGLATAAISRRLPILGICRGSQVLFVATGGRLIADLPGSTDGSGLHRSDPRTPSTHPVNLQADTRLRVALQTRRVTVTSYHHQGLDFAAGPVAQWRAAASSDDGVVEGIEWQGEAWIVGVLWHPEIPVDVGKSAPDPLLARFVREAGGAS